MPTSPDRGALRSRLFDSRLRQPDGGTPPPPPSPRVKPTPPSSEQPPRIPVPPATDPDGSPYHDLPQRWERQQREGDPPGYGN